LKFTFDEARQVLGDVTGLESDFEADKEVYARAQQVLAGEGCVMEMAAVIAGIIKIYSQAIGIYNGISSAVNAMTPLFEQIRKPKHLKITDEASLHYDLEDLAKNIPLLAIIKIAKDAGDVSIDKMVDYLLIIFND